MKYICFLIICFSFFGCDIGTIYNSKEVPMIVNKISETKNGYVYYINFASGYDFFVQKYKIYSDYQIYDIGDTVEFVDKFDNMIINKEF